ncbi:MAG: DNA polymerase III subunit delta [Candidatus Zixiibacteriota bacterium]|nr:MAG: DNA polymerase III subunit delta [candidate division Zixibacteria bacterium]
MSGDKNIIDKIRRFYLFYGTNEYKLDERVSALVKAVIPEGSEIFDLDRFEGRRCDVPELINSVSTPPVMSPLRIVLLSNTEKLPASGQKMLSEFLDKIPEYSVLAMTASRADKRSGLFKKLLALDKKQSFKYGEFTSSEAAKLVVGFAARRGKKIDLRVADMLVSIFGIDPYRLENEVEKLALYTGDEAEIGKKDLAFSAGFARIETPYDLPDLIFSGQLAAALELTSRALMSGISEMQILYILKNHLFRLCVSYNHHDIKEVMRLGQMPFYAARTVMAQSGKITPKAAFRGLADIFRAEYSLKSARFRPDVVIESLVMKLFLEIAGNNNV